MGEFEARKYEDESGRFTSIDEKWEEYRAWSPYNYSGNDPVNTKDPDGKRWTKLLKDMARSKVVRKVAPKLESKITKLENRAENWANKAFNDAVRWTKDAAKSAWEGVKNLVGKSDKGIELTKASVNEKLEKYLLNPDHPVGGSKAQWFKQALGFTKENMGDLAKQIIFDPAKAVQTDVTQYGTKFNQVISVTGANGKVIDVTFAWIKNNDGIIRLVTSIPAKK